MNQDEIKSLLVKVLLMAITPLATKFGIDGNTSGAIAAWAASGLVLAYGIYDHWNQKKVSDKATAVMLPTGPAKVGTTLDLAPMTGMVKVVGAILICFFVFQAMPASAQNWGQQSAGIKAGKFPDPLNLANGGPLAPGGAISNDVAKFLESLADVDTATTLSTQIPALQDNVGKACWTQFGPIQALIKAHPLPITFKLASDIEAARLLAIALNQICANPNCGQMWVDAGNAASAITGQAGLALPMSLTSVCAHVPVIATSAAQTIAGTTLNPAPVTSITPTPTPVITPVATPTSQ